MYVTAAGSEMVQGASLSTSIGFTFKDGFNIALFKPASASSVESGQYSAPMANDQSLTTRWSSLANDNQWWQVDLQGQYQVSKIIVNWESAFGKNYNLFVSNDPTFASSRYIGNMVNGDGGKDIIITDSTKYGRYLRLQGINRGTNFGYSIYELQAYGNKYTPAPTVPAAPLTRCGPGAVHLTATATAGDTILWYAAPSGGSPLSASSAFDAQVTVTDTFYVAALHLGYESKRIPFVATVLLTPTPIITSTGTLVVCPGKSVTLQSSGGPLTVWSNGTTGQNLTVTTPGTYTATVINGACTGSTSVPVVVTQGTPSTKTITATICGGHPFNLNGWLIDTSGVYLSTLSNASGCDSVVTLFLTVKPSSADIERQTVCEGTTVSWRNRSLFATGYYADTLTNAIGCDSILALNLTVNPKSATVINKSICTGSQYVFNNDTLSLPGTYTALLRNFNGCDSTVTLNLANGVPMASTVSDFVCAGNAYAFHGQNLTVSGTYVAIVPSSGGCDSTITLNLQVRNPSTAQVNATACAGSVYHFNGRALTIPGTFLDTLINAAGCDSVVTLNLAYKPVYRTSETGRICGTGNFVWHTRTLTLAGTYTDTLRSVYGCDSITTLTLLVLPLPRTTNKTGAICQGNSFLFNGQSITTTGVYTAHYRAASGCDSLVILTLTVYPSPAIPVITRRHDTLSTTAPGPYLWLRNGFSISGATSNTYIPVQSGAYSLMVFSTAGCISISDTISMVLGVETAQSGSKWTLFPNPTRSDLQITGLPTGTKLDIINTNGQSVYGTEYNGNALPLAGLPAGMYCIRASGRGQQLFIKE